MTHHRIWHNQIKLDPPMTHHQYPNGTRKTNNKLLYFKIHYLTFYLIMISFFNTKKYKHLNNTSTQKKKGRKENET